jgi:hypothetical protein
VDGLIQYDTVSAPDGSASGGVPLASQGIAAFEVRPTVTLDNGFLMGVGFRVGQAGLGDVNSSLVGGDLSIGYARRFGRFLPFLKGMFGINSYDVPGTTTGHQNDLRLDAVLGSRLYLSQRVYVSAAAFAGFGALWAYARAIQAERMEKVRALSAPQLRRRAPDYELQRAASS